LWEADHEDTETRRVAHRCPLTSSHLVIESLSSWFGVFVVSFCESLVCGARAKGPGTGTGTETETGTGAEAGAEAD